MAGGQSGWLRKPDTLCGNNTNPSATFVWAFQTPSELLSLFLPLFPFVPGAARTFFTFIFFVEPSFRWAFSFFLDHSVYTSFTVFRLPKFPYRSHSVIASHSIPQLPPACRQQPGDRRPKRSTTLNMCN